MSDAKRLLTGIYTLNKKVQYVKFLILFNLKSNLSIKNIYCVFYRSLYKLLLIDRNAVFFLLSFKIYTCQHNCKVNAREKYGVLPALPN